MAKNDIDFQLVKQANKKSTYTAAQIREIARCARDPLYFMQTYMWIQHPVKGRMHFEAYDYQKRLVNTYWTNTSVIALLPRQSGKALALDTLMATPSGWTTMGDIQIGDTIIAANGKPTTVTFATEIMHNHTCYELEFDNGDKVVADAEHLWQVTSSNWRIKNQVKTTEQIAEYLTSHVGNRRIWIDIASPMDLPDVDLPIAPYALGVWLGHGAWTSERVAQCVDLSVDVVRYIEQDGSVHSPSHMHSLNSEIRAIYGLMPLLCGENLLKHKHIPALYLRASVHQRLELLRGLMDTAGSVDKGGHCKFYQKHTVLTKQVRELLSSLGIKSRLQARLHKGQPSHALMFTTARHEVFKLKRKLHRQTNCQHHPKHSRLYIKTIKQCQSVPVRCIQVADPTHMFTCGETMVPTHNTTTAAGYLLWYAMFNRDVTILIAANKFRAANEIMDRVKFSYEELPDWLRAGVATYNVQDIKFDNGSRIKATTTTPDSGRGMSISLLYLDEFAFVKPRIAEEFWTAMAPTLATGGKCIITSTPNSDEDKFAEIWFGANKTIDEYGNDTPDGLGINGFRGFTAHYSEVPGRDEAWAARESAKIGSDRFRREYGCDFLTADETLINAVTLLKLQGTDPLYRTNQIRWYDHIKANAIYLVALDPSAGVGKDDACIQVFSLPDMAQVAEWSHNRTSIPQQVRIMQGIVNLIHSEMKKHSDQRGEPEVYFTLENNSWGEGAILTIDEMGEDSFNGIWLHEPKVKGMTKRRGLNTNTRSKAMACTKLKSLVESDKLKLRSRMLVRQLKFFVSHGDSFRGKSGEHDDAVMALILCVRMMQMVTRWDESIGNLMKDDFNDVSEEPMPISFGY